MSRFKEGCLNRILGLSIVLTVAFPIAAGATGAIAEFCSALLAGRTNSARPASAVTASLLITSEAGNATNGSSGAQFPIRIVQIQIGNKISYLHALTPQQIPAGASLDIRVQNGDGSETNVVLPSSMREQILDYLRAGGAPSSPFDCNCFAHYMNGVEYIFGQFDNSRWRVDDLPEERSLSLGDTIIIGHDRQTLTHFAIYLGNGFYLSKFGSSGPLIVADIPAMKIGFGGDAVYRTTPISLP